MAHASSAFGRLAASHDGVGALGWLGLEEQVEPVLRRIVADRLADAWPGTDTGTEGHIDLRTDELTLVAIAMDIERALGASLTTSVLRRVATTADLVDATLRAMVERGRATGDAPVVRVRFTPTCTGDAPFIEQLGRFTPYFADLVRRDAARLASGGRVDVWFADDTPWRSLVAVGAVLNRAAAPGLRIHAHRVPARELGGFGAVT